MTEKVKPEKIAVDDKQPPATDLLEYVLLVALIAMCVAIAIAAVAQRAAACG